MFGHSYFGASYFGGAYFGPAAGAQPQPQPVAVVGGSGWWDYVHVARVAQQWMWREFFVRPYAERESWGRVVAEPLHVEVSCFVHPLVAGDGWGALLTRRFSFSYVRPLEADDAYGQVAARAQKPSRIEILRAVAMWHTHRHRR